MKAILVTTDFSELAERALKPAADLAGRLNAKLILGHVVTSEKPPVPDKDAAHYTVAKRLYEADAEMESSILAALQERADELKPTEVVIDTARGGAIEGILKLAQAHEVGMIVISSLGRTGLRRLFLGSVAEELARNSPIPVLVWKEPADAKG